MGAISYEWRDASTRSGFSIRFNPVTREVRSWKEELVEAARGIVNATDRRVWIALSGGLESEVMANAFFQQGINFSAFTLAHDGNRQETERARNWCFFHGVPHKIVPLDARRFLTEDVDAYIKAGYATGSVYRYLQLRILETAESLGGYGVLGFGRLNFMMEEGDREVHIGLGESFAVPFEWMRANEIAHEPYFFLANPEAAQAYFDVPIVRFALSDERSFRNSGNNNSLRRFVCIADWPDIEWRPKAYGFEQFMPLVRGANERLRSAFGTSERVSRLSLAEVRAQLGAR